MLQRIVVMSAALVALLLPASSSAAGQEPASAAATTTVSVFDRAPIAWSEDAPELQPHDPYVLRDRGQTLERTLTLPTAPADQRDAQRIIATVTVTPVKIVEGDQVRLGDPWSRLGHVRIVQPGPGRNDRREIEILRFITGFGGETTFVRDLTAYAPLLHGQTTIRATLMTWFDPAWEVSMTLEYREGDAGYRRPTFAESLINEAYYTSRNATRSATVTIPQGVSLPRLHVLSTGHGGLQEFASADHVVRIDGVEVARWRPWREDGGLLHAENPTSERFTLGGRELWSADLDRAGWMPGDVVEPMIIPLPELLPPGRHRVEIEIEGIRPLPPDVSDPLDGPFWVLSAMVVADEPWPAADMPEEDADGESEDEGDDDDGR